METPAQRRGRETHHTRSGRRPGGKETKDDLGRDTKSQYTRRWKWRGLTRSPVNGRKLSRRGRSRMEIHIPPEEPGQPKDLERAAKPSLPMTLEAVPYRSRRAEEASGKHPCLCHAADGNGQGSHGRANSDVPDLDQRGREENTKERKPEDEKQRPRNHHCAEKA